MKKISSEITLIILSRNRQHCLMKTLNYYSNQSLNILVIDNSKFPLNKKFIPSNCTYIHSKTNFAQRSQLASKLIKTRYAIMGADDEIYLPSALFKMQRFLDNNLSYESVGGVAMAVWKYGPKTAASWAYKETLALNNRLNTPLARIKFHTRNGIEPRTAFFTTNLTRSVSMKRCLNLYANSPVVATDALSLFSICGAGKSIYLKEVYWIRNWNQSPKSNSNWNRNISLGDWWLDKQNRKERLKFMSKLRSVYAEFFGKNYFEETWNLILLSSLSTKISGSKLRSYFTIFTEYDFVKNVVYLLKKILFPLKIPDLTEDILLEFKKNSIKFNISELLPSIKIVKDLRPYRNW